ncbi:MAG TPA: hypothetical protein VNR18_02015 [Hyphomicrobiales bacterium]|nr:hypothetical protein [Hyphomicrobiales bacterium]
MPLTDADLDRMFDRGNAPETTFAELVREPISAWFILEPLHEIDISKSNGAFQRLLAVAVAGTGIPVLDLTIGQVVEIVSTCRDIYNKRYLATGCLGFAPGEAERLLDAAALPSCRAAGKEAACSRA